MHIMVYGTKMEVEVTNEGMFVDSATKRLHGRTLAGLEKKMLDAYKPQGSYPVEHKSNGKKGTVVNVINNKRAYNIQYGVTWEDGTKTIEAPYSLQKCLSPEEKSLRDQLRTNRDQAQTALNAAQNAYLAFESTTSVNVPLSQAFKAK